MFSTEQGVYEVLKICVRSGNITVQNRLTYTEFLFGIGDVFTISGVMANFHSVYFCSRLNYKQKQQKVKRKIWPVYVNKNTHL